MVKTTLVKKTVPNAFTGNGKALVSKVNITGNLRRDIRKAVSLIGDLARIIKPNDTVLLKPNYVFDAPYPATTSPDFLRAVVEIVKEYHPSRILIGESSAYWQNTRRNMERHGAFDVARETGAEIYIFDDYDWVRIAIPNGKYQKSTKIPRILDEVNCLIFLPCLKTHRLARYTCSLKLAFGCTKKSERVAHFINLEPKVAEVASVIWPDLCIVDARKIFITHGPGEGDAAEPGLFLASGDRIAIDVEGVKIIQSYPAKNRLDMDAWELPTIRRAIELGLGAESEKDYILKSSEKLDFVAQP
ncbi:MAG: DUF362 domain-containing protein [Planctomycetes bacterium]|nr:DUF362 domain-containing protein [Planctomycetota bacterium]